MGDTLQVTFLGHYIRILGITAIFYQRGIEKSYISGVFALVLQVSSFPCGNIESSIYYLAFQFSHRGLFFFLYLLPAGMNLRRFDSSLPIPLNYSLYHCSFQADREESQCLLPTSMLCHIFDPYKFLLQKVSDLLHYLSVCPLTRLFMNSS